MGEQEWRQMTIEYYVEFGKFTLLIFTITSKLNVNWWREYREISIMLILHKIKQSKFCALLVLNQWKSLICAFPQSIYFSHYALRIFWTRWALVMCRNAFSWSISIRFHKTADQSDNQSINQSISQLITFLVLTLTTAARTDSLTRQLKRNAYCGQ